MPDSAVGDDSPGWDEAAVGALLEAFGLGTGTLSPRPVACGRLGQIWRLDTTSGTWAVKTMTVAASEAEVAESAAFQDAVVAAGVPAPAIRRTRDGTVLAHAGGQGVRVMEWVDLQPVDLLLDPAAVGKLLAGLHQVPFEPSSPFGAFAPSSPSPDRPDSVDPWFTAPVGAARWDEVVAAVRERGAPFAGDLAAQCHERVALEALLRSPTHLRQCHRDLFADNVRATAVPSPPPLGLAPPASPPLSVFDFDSCGPADPSQELAFVLAEFAFDDGERARTLVDAYIDAGGTGRVGGPGAFSMVIATLGHIVELGCHRWLAATTDEEREDNAAWVAESTTRPFTRETIARLLDR